MLAAATTSSVCSDVGVGGVSLLQASQKLWHRSNPKIPKTTATKTKKEKTETSESGDPAPPAQSSLDQVLGPEPQVNLEDAFNYSVVENISGELAENLTEPGDVYMVKSIKGAKPVSVNPSTAKNLRDCLMGDWSAWSECLVTPKTGLKGPHQVRQRSILQPWLPGGAPCLPQLEGRECAMLKPIQVN